MNKFTEEKLKEHVIFHNELLSACINIIQERNNIYHDTLIDIENKFGYKVKIKVSHESYKNYVNPTSEEYVQLFSAGNEFEGKLEWTWDGVKVHGFTFDNYDGSVEKIETFIPMQYLELYGENIFELKKLISETIKSKLYNLANAIKVEEDKRKDELERKKQKEFQEAVDNVKNIMKNHSITKEDL